ncbi:MAG: glycine cleavage system aminomethyltransferase GcvT, partial [Arenicellales bacterium]|nr:glycine cleavage system aminomethyltransferase GcvT [Arenicellales bacterium]
HPVFVKRTPLYELHTALGAKMVPFAGYEMPVQYPSGILFEHRQVRASAGLFDVSHMGQATVFGDDSARLLETVLPANLLELPNGSQRYSFFTNDAGGILDDLMIYRLDDRYTLVVNASNKEADFALLQNLCGGKVEFEPMTNHALLALQGPRACNALQRMVPGIEELPFMGAKRVIISGIPCTVTRSGYTGEDGVEISVGASAALDLAWKLLELPEVEPVGLGARDSLRLEAGLCLHGNDIGPDTSPVEAGLQWAIPHCRRTQGSRRGGFPGAERILAEIDNGTLRRRVGIRPEGKAPVRAHAELLDTDSVQIGEVSSGGFGPSINAPVAMGYVAKEYSTPGTALHALVRNKLLPVTVCSMPFSPHRYHTKEKKE